jgi:RimJ/RimL family protein N-acetyltransferase
MPFSQPPDPRDQIQHYPATLIETRVHRRSRQLTMRPILPQDAKLLAQLLDGLAPETRRNRFHGAIRLSSNHLQQMSHVDYRRHLAMVVTTEVDGAERLIADARYVVEPGGDGAEFALVVADGWQCQGVGTWAMQSLQRAGSNAGLQWLQGGVLNSNLPMLSLMQRCGFAQSPDAEDAQLVRVQRRLGSQGVPLPAMRHDLRSWLRSAWRARHPALAR